MSNQELASLVGAPAGSTVRVTGYGGSIGVQSSPTHIEAAGRTISNAQRRHRDPQRHLQDQGDAEAASARRWSAGRWSRPPSSGPGQSTAHAARGGDYIGYKVWPKYGYDGLIPAPCYRQLRGASELPASVRNATKISELYKSKEGIAWWEKNGSWISMSFDLKPGSYSMKKMASYQAERASDGPGNDVDSRHQV